MEIINIKLFKDIKKDYPDQLELSLQDDCVKCELEPEFMSCGTKIYQTLSEVISLNWTIIDIGCSYAAQAYYFRKHKKYIGIDLNPNIICPDIKRINFGSFRFTFENTEHWVKNAMELTEKDFKDFDLSETFAIMNWNPLWADLKIEDRSLNIRKIFKNLYIHYPH
jgi:hypothetical protein